MATITSPLKCQTCESTEPAKEYNPHTPKHPDKIVILCDKCAEADPRATLKTPVEVPEIEPAVPDAENLVETIKFPPKESGEPSITTPKNAPPATEDIAPAPEPINTDGSIPRSEIVDDLKRRESDVAKLLESHRSLITEQRAVANKISTCLKILAIQQGAVAQLKSTLGIGKE